MSEASASARPDEGELEPGDPRAREHGCSCSVLANADYRARREGSPLIDPTCRVHAMP